MTFTLSRVANPRFFENKYSDDTIHSTTTTQLICQHEVAIQGMDQDDISISSVSNFCVASLNFVVVSLANIASTRRCIEFDDEFIAKENKFTH